MVSEAKAMKVKQRYSAQLLSRPEVSGVGVEKGEDGGFVLAVHVNSSDPEAIKNLPRELDGCPVKVVMSGPFKKS